MKILSFNNVCYVILLSVSLSITLETDVTCPNIPENGCTCHVYDEEIFLECSEISINSLQKIFPHFHDIPIQSLRIYELDKSITMLTIDNFQLNTIIKQIHISISNINTIGENTFRYFKDNLESLEISSSKLTRIPQLAMTGLVRLESIDFESNNIQELTNYCFYGLRLNKINLKDNEIHRIAEYALIGLEETLQQLDLSENRVKFFPISSVRKMVNLKEIKLSSNEISYIPDDGYTIMNSLTRLDISLNNFISITEDEFRCLLNLQSLSLHLNLIESIHKKAFTSLKNLQSIDLSHNKIVFIDSDTFKNNEKLINIDLSHNHVHYINGVFSNLPILEELILSENNILDIPSNSFENSTSLSVIYLQENSIKQIELNAFASLTALKQIYISQNFIEKIPFKLFANSTQLISLNLDNNLINEINEDIFENLINIQELRLNDNLIKLIKNGIFDSLINLLELHLQNNVINWIEFNSFDKMINLRHINLQGNLLTQLSNFYHPSSIILSIQLNSNKINSIDINSFEGQKNVKIIWLQNNELIKLNENIFKDQRELQMIYLTNNSINQIDDATFSNLISLQFLDLNYNQLKTITENMFKNLLNLSELYLSFNNIENIEFNSFKTLIKLTNLDLSNNPLIKINLNLFQKLPILFLNLENCSLISLNSSNQDDNGFKSLKSITKLNLKNNFLTSESLNSIKSNSLKIINFSKNNLTNLSDAIFSNVKFLSEIYFDENQISDFQISKNEFNSNLIILSLIGNKLKSLPDDLKFKNLKILNLDENEFDLFPYNFLSNSISLKVFTISGNNLTTVDFSKINDKIPRYLTDIDLSKNYLTLFKGFTSSCNFSHLHSIRLDFNLLSTLPKHFFHTAISLKSLNLASNRFRYIPSISIFTENLPNLKYLNLSDNPLIQFNSEISPPNDKFPPLEEVHITWSNITLITMQQLQGFSDIIHFNLSFNKISIITSRAFRLLPNLSTLHIGFNEMSTLNSDIFEEMIHVTMINFTHNQLITLKQFPSDLKALQILDLSFNRIRKIDKNVFVNLNNLIELYLRGNRIVSISVDAFRPLKKLTFLDVSHNQFESLPLNAFRPLETHIRSLYAEENPLNCDCAQQELWEWLKDHQKLINKGKMGHGTNGLKCNQPLELSGHYFLQLDPSKFCTIPLVSKLAIQDIQPYSMIVSWQTRNHSSVFGYRVAYTIITTTNNDNNTIHSLTFDRNTRSARLTDLYSDTRYLICVLGLGNWQSTLNNTLEQYLFNVSDMENSKCTEIRTLDLGEAELQLRDPQESSILTRRLGLIIGCCMGFVVFIILVAVLAYMKMKKQERNAKNETPLPPEYLSYRHFSLQGSDPLTTQAHRITQNL